MMTVRKISSRVTVNAFTVECEFYNDERDSISLNIIDGAFPTVRQPFSSMSRSDLADLKEAIQRAVHND